MQQVIPNLERIEDTLSKIANFNATPGVGHTRFSYSDEDRNVREYLINELQQLDMTYQVDAVGNIRARLEGLNPDGPTIMAGSHIDTVLHGGRYDGALGVVAALEVARLIKEHNINFEKNYELIIFAEEEGSNFGVTTLGSKCLAGECSVDYLKKLKNADGVSAYELMTQFGLQPDKLQKSVLNKGEIEAMLELHIEQSIVLENRNIDIGVVEEIAGRKAFWVTLQGASGHAGATPMDDRQDALVGAAEVISSLAEITKRWGGKRTVATAGKIVCKPNVSNSIVGQVEFSLDIRDVDDQWMSNVATGIEEKLKAVSTLHQLQYTMDLQGASDGMHLTADIVQAVEDTTTTCGYSNLRMVSGAVHDAALLAKLTDVGMIFIPSIGGVSHVPHEDSKPEHIQAGCNVLFQTILTLANTK